MRSQMSPEIEIKREAFEADLTLKRLFPRVNQLVPPQFGVIKESLPAALKTADELSLAMHKHVLLH